MTAAERFNKQLDKVISYQGAYDHGFSCGWIEGYRAAFQDIEGERKK